MPAFSSQSRHDARMLSAARKVDTTFAEPSPQFHEIDGLTGGPHAASDSVAYFVITIVRLPE